jgi:hypothetical protein
MKTLSQDEIKLDPEHYDLVNRWLARGDGIAVYENADLGHPELGHRQFLSFGSTQAQIETNEPPQRLPDIGNRINWRYQLVGIYKGAALT